MRPTRRSGLGTRQNRSANRSGFDNTDGRLIENLKPCEKDIRFDARGRAMPMGTVHRLDAISKSFLGIDQA
jgi:hypothetical protein